MKKIILFFTCCLIHNSITDANMMKDMAIMMGAQMGASAANQSVTQKFTDMEKAFGHSETHINAAINIFQTDITAAQSTQLTTIFHWFSQAQTQIKSLLTAQQGALKQSEDYLQKAISQQQGQAQYLSDPGSTDQFFTHATMYTPQGSVWKNLFYPNGNWEYDETSDSFWQMSYAPLLSAPTDNSSATNSTPNADHAPTNSIFTEWFTTQASYEVECEITLYKIEYPFFVGLIFNKARWISGDMPRIQKYRLFGLYGNTNKKVQVCFAEAYDQTTSQATTPTATASTQTTTTFPLQQIVAGSGVQKIKVDDNALQDLTIQPVTFRLKVQTYPTQIKLKFWPVTAQEPSNFITVQSNNQNLYLYHGIGFISPGAIAQFKLLQPTALLFSKSARDIFKSQVQSLTSIISSNPKEST